MAARDDEKLRKRWETSRFRELYPNVTYEEFIKSFPAKNKKDEVNRDKVKKELKKPSQKWGEKQLQENIEQLTDPTKIAEQYKEMQEVVEPLIESEKSTLGEEREGYKQQAKEDVTTNLPGLTPQQRRVMQQGANAQINKQVQQYKRNMASQMGRRGVRGGAAFAPQAEIARSGLEAQSQFQRDLGEMDTDLAMRRLAAYLSSVEGRTAQQLLRRGQYLDYLTGRQQQGRQSAYDKYFQNLYSGVK